MGSSRWSDSDWAGYSSTTSKKSAAEIFSVSAMKDDYNPSLIKVRESRDSDVNPNSTAVILASDVTGSMGRLAENLIRKGLGVVFEELLSRKPVSDPHLMVMAVGDVTCDRAPLQCTQFEADITIATQLEEIYIEGGGGGNRWESYNLPWYFAADKTEIDCFEKRGKKGYLFTIGDEEVPESLTRSQLKSVLDSDLQSDSISNRDLLTLASRKYEIFHIMIEEGNHMRHSKNEVVKAWTDLLGQRAILLSDYTKLAEVVVAAIEINEGRSADDVVASWGSDLAIASAVGGMSMAKKSTAKGIVRL